MTTITPPFTGSYAVGLQGINVSRFDLYGMSVSPKMGRNGTTTFVSSSNSGVINVSSENRKFFDDSLRLPKQVAALTSTTANVEVISDDSFRVVEIPRFMLSRQTIGIEETNNPENPFEEMNGLDPVVYLTDPSSVAYPVVFGVDSPIDPLEFSGVIEPFVIRKTIAGTSTFIGDHDDPEPSGIRGTISSGQTKVTTRNKTVVSSNYYLQGVANQFSVYEEVGTPELDELAIGTDFPIYTNYVSDAGQTSEPFIDKTSIDETYYNVSNKEMRIELKRMSTRTDMPDGYPDSVSLSKPCGFIYQNSRGIDSIAYGGLLK